MTLVLILLLSIGSTGFAAANFSDVPSKHWAYGAVSQLAKDGLVEGYGDGTFRGEKTLTRYEFAVAIARALEKYNKADAQQKVLLDKLSVEFATELNAIGARVSVLETKVNKLGNVTFNGDVRLRGIFYNDKISGVSDKASFFQSRARINFQSKVSDDTEVFARFAVRNSFGQSTVANYQPFDQYGVKLTANNWKIAIGRQDVGLGQGLIISTGSDAEWDHKFDGLIASTKAGNVDVNLIAGKTTTSNVVNNCLGGLDQQSQWYGFDLNSKVATNLSLGAAYARGKPDNSIGRNYSAVNFTYDLSAKFTINGEYEKSNATNNNTSHLIGGTYHWAKDSFNVQYQKIGINSNEPGNSGYSYIGFPFEGTNLKSGPSWSGLMYTYNHQLNKNTALTLLYLDLKSEGQSGHDKEGCIQLLTKF